MFDHPKLAIVAVAWPGRVRLGTPKGVDVGIVRRSGEADRPTFGKAQTASAEKHDDGAEPQVTCRNIDSCFRLFHRGSAFAT